MPAIARARLTPHAFTLVFLIALGLSLVVQLWLARRHASHVARYRSSVPPSFAERIALPAHQKAADYTIVRTRFGMIEAVFDAAMLIVFTLGGVMAALVAWTGTLPGGPLLRDLALMVAVGLIAGALSLPFSWYRTFVIEARFGFNRMTRKLWLVDLAKGLLLAAVLGLPLTALALWLMRVAGPLWWLWVWAVWVGFQFLMLAIYPSVIAPLFNKFSPLPWPAQNRTR